MMINHPPAARGVNQLMYVGDDQVEATSSISTPLKLAVLAVAAWLLFGRRR